MFIIDDLLFWTTVAVLATGMITVAYVVAWTICAVADWVFGLFEKKDADACLVISNQDAMDSMAEAVRKRNPDMADRIKNALEGREGARKMSIWQKGGGVTEVQFLSAKDTSVDELGEITRFDRDGRIREF